MRMATNVVPSLAEVQAAALDKIDAAIKTLQVARDQVQGVAAEAPGVAHQARRNAEIANAQTGEALASVRWLVRLTEPVDDEG